MKKFYLFVCSILAVFLLSACGGNSKGADFTDLFKEGESYFVSRMGETAILTKKADGNYDYVVKKEPFKIETTELLDWSLNNSIYSGNLPASEVVLKINKDSNNKALKKGITKIKFRYGGFNFEPRKAPNKIIPLNDEFADDYVLKQYGFGTYDKDFDKYIHNEEAWMEHGKAATKSNTIFHNNFGSTNDNYLEHLLSVQWFLILKIDNNEYKFKLNLDRDKIPSSQDVVFENFGTITKATDKISIRLEINYDIAYKTDGIIVSNSICFDENLMLRTDYNKQYPADPAFYELDGKKYDAYTFAYRKHEFKGKKYEGVGLVENQKVGLERYSTLNLNNIQFLAN